MVLSDVLDAIVLNVQYLFWYTFVKDDTEIVFNFLIFSLSCKHFRVDLHPGNQLFLPNSMLGIKFAASVVPSKRSIFKWPRINKNTFSFPSLQNNIHSLWGSSKTIFLDWTGNFGFVTSYDIEPFQDSNKSYFVFHLSKSHPKTHSWPHAERYPCHCIHGILAVFEKPIECENFN